MKPAKLRPEGPLGQLIRRGVTDLVAAAVEAELQDFLERHAHLRLPDGAQAVVRNGYLPRRTLQTSLGDIDVQVPRIRDRSGLGIHFNSVLLPPYLKRARDRDELLPWFYLQGFIDGNFREALTALLDQGVEALSERIESRLRAIWQEELRAWRQRNLRGKRYLYWRADRFAATDGHLLVVAGITESDGRQELLVLGQADATGETEWRALLLDLKQRHLEAGPKLADGEHAPGFRTALDELFPSQQAMAPRTAGQADGFPPAAHGASGRPFSAQTEPRRTIR